MNKLHKITLLIATSAMAGPAFADCGYPQDVSIPDGAAASEAEMVEGQKGVKGYMAEMDEYLKCLDEKSAALGEEITEEDRLMHVKKHNAAVDAMEQVAANFNEQIRAFKAKNN